VVWLVGFALDRGEDRLPSLLVADSGGAAADSAWETA